jgi:hypothetical protein
MHASIHIHIPEAIGHEVVRVPEPVCSLKSEKNLFTLPGIETHPFVS